MCQLIRSQLINIVLLCFAKSLFADSVCGDWQTYKDEKCFMIFDALQSYDEATNTCIQYSATLVTISSPEEQQFIETYLFTTHKIVENVWTGLRYTNSQYKWISDLEVKYTQWSEGSPKNRSDYCVQINSDDISLGKWSDVSCTKHNYALCQRLPTVTIQHLQTMLFNTRNQMESTNKLLSEKLEKSLTQQNVTNQLLNTTVNELSLIKKQFAYFFIDNWVEFQTFSENNTRKAFFYPYKTQTYVSRSVALEICSQYNASLVEIESIEKQKLVESFLHKISQKTIYNWYWLGGYIDPTDNYKYKWLNSGNAFTYTNWYSGQPANNNPYLSISNTGDGYDTQWYSRVSTETQNFFCEITFN